MKPEQARITVTQVAVVTGATSGIGKAIALALSKEGINLCLLGRNSAALHQVAMEAQALGVRAVSCPVDLTRDEDVKGLGSSFLKHFDRLDILVHSAGVISRGAMAVAPVEDFDLQWKTNVRAPYCMTQMLLPSLRKCQGQIVFINSSAGIVAREGVGQYAATKHALKAIADVLRSEENRNGIRVLSMFLGRTATPMQKEVHRQEGSPYLPDQLLQPEDVAEAVVNALRHSRTAEITDIHLRSMQKPLSSGQQ